jgi:hypothetical protein
MAMSMKMAGFCVVNWYKFTISEVCTASIIRAMKYFCFIFNVLNLNISNIVSFSAERLLKQQFMVGHHWMPHTTKNNYFFQKSSTPHFQLTNFLSLCYSSWNNTVPQDLFDALEEQRAESNTDSQHTVPQFFELWTTQPGYPVINVTRKNGNITVTQVSTAEIIRENIVTLS